MNPPWNAERLQLKVTKHFALKYMRSWGWDFHDLQDAIRNAYAVKKVGREKFEIFTEKDGYKKIITIYLDEHEEMLCITGSQGGGRI